MVFNVSTNTYHMTLSILTGYRVAVMAVYIVVISSRDVLTFKLKVYSSQ